MKKFILILISLIVFSCGKVKVTTDPESNSNEFVDYSSAMIAMDIETTFTTGYNAYNYITGVTSNTNFYVSVYGKNVNNLSGYDVRFTFDSEEITFISASEKYSMTENNILGSSGLVAITQLSGGESNQVILAAVRNDTNSVTHSDWKLLGVVSFQTSDSFISSDVVNFVFNYAELINPDRESSYIRIGNEQNAAINTTRTQRSSTLTK